MNKFRSLFLSFFIISSLLITGCTSNDTIKKDNTNSIKIEEPEKIIKIEPQEYLTQKENTKNKPNITPPNFDINSIPNYTDKPFAVINNNIPFFLANDLVTESFEYYSDLDSLGRCGFAFANIGTDIMPTEKRESISHITPSGWKSVQYDNIDGKNLYNRSHLIGFQLSAENANEKNLITGTRYLNVTGMLPFENMVADYVKETNNHVLYRVTPIFKNDNLIADGVLMEAKSVEDNGEGILFNVFVYNVQPEITIDYKTGESYLTNPPTKHSETQDTNLENKSTTHTENVIQENKHEFMYVLNTNTKKVHMPNCRTIKNLSPSNRGESTDTISKIIDRGYVPCKVCTPR